MNLSSRFLAATLKEFLHQSVAADQRALGGAEQSVKRTRHHTIEGRRIHPREVVAEPPRLINGQSCSGARALT